MNMRTRIFVCLATWIAAGAGAEERAAVRVTEPNLAARTVVVFNPEFPQSRELAEYYAQRRGIAADRVVGLKAPIKDSMSRQEFDALLRRPLAELFVRRGWWRVDEQRPETVVSADVRVLVLMRGVPFQVRRGSQNPEKSHEDEASVDSELALLGAPPKSLAGATKNPYHGQPLRFHEFTAAPGMLLVARLDAPQAETVKRMIDDAVAAEKTGLRGRAVIDLALKGGAYEAGEKWLKGSASHFRRHGIPVYVDEDEPVLPDHWPLPDTALYFGWYTTNASGAVNSPSFRFRAGAVACHLHSFSASALRSGDRHWVGPLLEKGAAAVMGNVFEPYLALTVHFDAFNDRLLQGWTLAEAAWNATPVLSWMNVVVGDPLYRPFGAQQGTGLGEGQDRDYALYAASAARHGLDDTSKLKRALAEMAQTRRNSHLLELTALLSASEGRTGEALGLLEHAETLHENPADRLRLRLYQAEWQRRAGKPEAVKSLLAPLIEDPAFTDLPALKAAQGMLKEMP
jgi:uncharacterized protein (TIGR03790 family)